MGIIYITPKQGEMIRKQIVNGSRSPDSFDAYRALHSLSPYDRAKQELIIAQRNTHPKHRPFDPNLAF